MDRALTPAEASVPPAPPSPVLTTESFQALCSGPPVQGPSVKRHARNFEPLSPEELKGPGLLLGIDAEFVAHAPAEKVMQGSAPAPASLHACQLPMMLILQLVCACMFTLLLALLPAVLQPQLYNMKSEESGDNKAPVYLVSH